MSRRNSSAAAILEVRPAEAPILIGDGFEVFEGWGALTPEQLAECEQAEAALVSGRVEGVPHEEAQRRIEEMRPQQGG